MLCMFKKYTCKNSMLTSGTKKMQKMLNASPALRLPYGQNTSKLLYKI